MVFPAATTSAELSEEPSLDEVKDTMKRATRFMVEKVSHRGGYVWFYLPDFSRRWGELEARETMIWIQPPGTATMGHVFLDAYHATGDEYYYAAAEQVAGAIIWAQHPAGGWNYVADFGGEASLRDWYKTIGKNAWRLEEFHHYYGNATFDDGGTAEAAKFLLRLYNEKLDPTYRPPLDKAISFMLDSQYPIGGWPQRYPLRHEYSRNGQPDYTSFITFNDDVAQENIDFLLMCYQVLGEQRVREPVIRAMNAFLITQLGQPQPGWALQYTTELQPAGARSYEPRSLSPATTAENVRQLLKFYRMTGETKFLARIPDALDWLDAVRLPRKNVTGGRTHPTFVEVGTGKTLYTHRHGSNVTNGEYYVDYEPGNELIHYRSIRHVDVEQLRQLFKEAKALTPDVLTKGSPLKSKTAVELPRYFTLGNINLSDLNTRALPTSLGKSLSEDAERLRKELNQEGYWPVKLHYTTNSYRGGAPATVAAGNFSNTNVGDQWDTSPYETDDPVTGISTGAYIKNMGVLIKYLVKNQQE
ncbi:pectate lyase [Cellvibrio sp. PSBB006]|uniref:pectate lyase n=1 Tax=Cellvibrio sp. PSBB006 TaxID=1987723 RepID=UPI001E40B0D4|nr:pectate lyase [Cellvibrio sp. PSBB006]